ncbi:MAG: hypothetical protein IJ680_03110 [Paludibacteraceae bacterium]|nr:hypothetical protein [Paludibacteraceae bacterium]
MKKTLLMMLLSGAVMSGSVMAKDKKTQTVPEATPVVEEEEPAVSQECLVNLSLFNESVRNKQYADAIEPWVAVYSECPNANKVLYTRGRTLVLWQIEQAKKAGNSQEVDRLRSLLMEMFDKRIKYFGDDPKQPAAYVLGLKALDYVSLYPEDTIKTTAYNWMRQSIDERQAESDIDVLDTYLRISLNMFKADSEKAENYINDYLMIGNLLAQVIEANAESADSTAFYVKQNHDTFFALSGVATREILDKTYESVVDKNLNNVDELERVMKLYSRTRNTESEVYFKAATAAHKIRPSVESAHALAAMNYNRNENQQAIRYFEEAIKMSDNNSDKADFELTIGVIYNKLGNNVNSREHLRRSLSYNPNQCEPYLIIASMYAASKPYDDPVLNKTVYWAAVDQLIRARNASASCASKVNSRIAQYSKNFPNADEIFFRQEFTEGGSFTVGGWIGETTTCRSK